MRTSSSRLAPLTLTAALLANGCAHVRPVDRAERSRAAVLLQCDEGQVRDASEAAARFTEPSDLRLAGDLTSGSGAATAGDAAPVVATAVTLPVLATVVAFFAALDRVKVRRPDRRDVRYYRGCGGLVHCSDEEGCALQRAPAPALEVSAG